MQRVPVTQGNNISEVGYDPETQTLELKFSSGGIYSYAAVPPEIHDKLIHADSPGRYFAVYVRSCYEYTHLNPKPKKEEKHATVKETKDGRIPEKVTRELQETLKKAEEETGR